MRYIEMHRGPAAYILGPPLQGAEISSWKAESMRATSITYTSPETPAVSKLALYGDVIHSFNWKSAVEHDGGV